MEFVQPVAAKKGRSVVSIFFTIVYLLLLGLSASLPFIYQNLPIIGSAKLDQIIILVPSAALAVYFFFIALSFFLRGDNWLIFSIVLIFFSSVAAIILAVLGFLGGKSLWHSGIPSCSQAILQCNAEDGITLLSALLLGISIPALVLNLLTFFGIFKTLGTKD